MLSVNQIIHWFSNLWNCNCLTFKYVYDIHSQYSNTFFLRYIVLIFVFHTEVVSLITSSFFRHEMTFTNYSDTIFTDFLFNELSVSIDKIIARNTNVCQFIRLQLYNYSQPFIHESVSVVNQIIVNSFRPFHYDQPGQMLPPGPQRGRDKLYKGNLLRALS